MTEPMSDERLAEIRERAEKATPGPWIFHAISQWGYPQYLIGSTGYTIAEMCLDRSLAQHVANAEFIACARDDVPFLLAEVERLRRMIAG